MVEEYLTTKEVADRFKVSASSVSLWCRNGLIEAEKAKGRWQIERSVVEKLSDLDVKIMRTEAALGRKRATRIVNGKATPTEAFWFGMGFGRGRYAMGDLLIKGTYLGYLKIRRYLRERRRRKKEGATG